MTPQLSTRDLFEHILAMPRQHGSHYQSGDGSVTNTGNGLVQTNITNYYGNCVEPERDMDLECIPEPCYETPYAALPPARPDIAQRASSVGKACLIWLSVIMFGSTFVGIVALVVAGLCGYGQGK